MPLAWPIIWVQREHGRTSPVPVRHRGASRKVTAHAWHLGELYPDSRHRLRQSSWHWSPMQRRIEERCQQPVWLALNNQDASNQELFQSDVSLPLPPDHGFTEGDTAYMIAVNITAMSFLNHSNPIIF